MRPPQLLPAATNPISSAALKVRDQGPFGIARLRACLAFGLAALCLQALASLAAIPSAEKLLPDDTLVLVTVPDFTKLSEISRKLPPAQCWNDPALKPFKDKLLAKWKQEIVDPLEHELGVKCDAYRELLQGQLTFAVTQNGWQGQDDSSPGMLLLLDARDKSGQLKKNLAELRKKWVDAGKMLRTERIRDTEFIILPMSTNDVPKTLRKFFTKSDEVQELGDEKETKKATPKDELVLGQVESLLIVANSLKPVEKVVNRLAGGSIPALGELPAYQANHLALFRDAPIYGWANAKALLDMLLRAAAEKKENPDAPNPFDLKPEKIFTALGLTGIKTIAMSFQDSSDGQFYQFFVGVPESSRQGLLRILAGEPKESSPPPFVPADAIKFQRWRLDGQKAWETLQKVLADISPEMASGVNFLLDSANTAAKDKDPGFDIRKNLIGNLGDDMISYEKAPRTGESGKPAPSLFLLGSPNAEQFVSALKSILVFVTQQAGTPPEEREFLGRKIYTVKLGPMGLSTGGAGAAPSALSYAASGGYVALSTDAAVLEEYLRRGDVQGKALRDSPGLAEAMAKVTTPGTSLFGYQNNAEAMRVVFDTLRTEPASATNTANTLSATLSTSGFGFAGANQLFKEWFDFSLLPPFEKIAKYFYFTVYGGGATSEGLSLKMFNPAPPSLKVAEAKR